MERITWSTKTERVALEPGWSTQPSASTGRVLARAGIANPKDWTRLIVRDRANWPLAFNKWHFEDGGVAPDSIFIGDVELPDLPLVKDDEEDPRLGELIGHRVLPISKTGLKKFSVSFRVDPAPSKVGGLARFVAEVVSRDNGPTGLRRRKAAWTRNTEAGLISFTSIGKIDWEEGWHFVRIYAETDEGERIPLADGEGNPIRFSDGSEGAHTKPHESDLFYVVTDEEVEIEPPQRAVPRDPSLTHALLRTRFAAVVQDRDPASVSITGLHGWSEAANLRRAVKRWRFGSGKKARQCARIWRTGQSRARLLEDPSGVNRLRLSINASGVATRRLSPSSGGFG